ncbi:MAG TPA: AMP-binding protein, partial [Micromonosporaceae bacterium]
ERIDTIVRGWAERTPDAVAVRWSGTEFSYRQLVDEADRLADGLRAIGLRPCDVVAGQLPRTPDLVCLLLAVLQVGAIYTLMPLDWPTARRGEVLDLTGARICVSADADAFEAETPMVSLERLRLAEPGALPSRTAGRPALDEHLGDLSEACCVFFTSGSTGRPKCAVAPHRGVIRVAMDPESAFNSSTVLLQSASMAWDLFAFELWSPLLNGGTAVLRSSDYFSYDDLRLAIKDGVNTVFLTPTLFNGAVADDIEVLSGVRTVFIGGDRASAKSVETFLNRFPGSAVINLYGPVEATIWISRYRMTSIEDFDDDVPVGSPGVWTDVYLLDDDRNVVGLGEIGEIAAAGPGLAFGYLGNAEETAKRFRMLPLGPGGAEIRVYLTGDFGSIDDDGRLRFHGRRDRQVKIQSVRVEPHEVERVVGELPGVNAVVAMPIPVGAIQPDGIALIYATGQSSTPRPDEVREAVQATLPVAFVPRVIRQVDSLPLNAYEKLDQQRITKLIVEAAEERAGASGRPERTPLMTLLLEIEALTGVPAAMDSDVVKLGLTSISGLKLINRMRAIHGIRLPMNVIFRSRTPEAIAQWIAEH